VIDLHCHVVPGVDDGPATIAESLDLCRIARNAGTETIIATPHVNHTFPGVGSDVILEGVEFVNGALREAAIDLVVRPGAELALSRAAELSDDELKMLRLGGGPYLLVELPSGLGAAGIENALRLLADRGHGILIAHPERSRLLRQDPNVLHRFVELGFLSCVNVRALAGRSGRETQVFAWSLLGDQLVHAIASDAHDPVRRPPALGTEIERIGLPETQIDYFTRVMPRAIVEGTSVVPPPPVKPPRPGGLRGLARFFRGGVS
jgi:protein-tyrosine phosphatase